MAKKAFAARDATLGAAFSARASTSRTARTCDRRHAEGYRASPPPHALPITHTPRARPRTCLEAVLQPERGGAMLVRDDSRVQRRRRLRRATCNELGLRRRVLEAQLLRQRRAPCSTSRCTFFAVCRPCHGCASIFKLGGTAASFVLVQFLELGYPCVSAVARKPNPTPPLNLG